MNTAALAGGQIPVWICCELWVFCFHLNKLNEPVELLRASSEFTEGGQPYFSIQKPVSGFVDPLLGQANYLQYPAD